MPAKLVERTDRDVTVQITIPFGNSMLTFEESLQKEMNQAGVLATEEQLKRFDTDGAPIVLGGTKFTSKGQVPKEYQTPFGVATVRRHVYQSPEGGPTFCPLDRDARIVVSSTPRFAKIVASKYAGAGSAWVRRDLMENHGRSVSRCLVQDLAEAVAAVALAKEESWTYELPKLQSAPRCIAVSLDGTCMLMCESGWREAMVGTIAFYDKDGERQHTVYMAATPEYGKSTFLDRLEREVTRTKQKYPAARYIGIADGANGNWDFLENHTEVQVVDFWHAAEYLGKAAGVFHARDSKARELWLEQECHTLKHEQDGAATVLRNLRSGARKRPWTREHDDVKAAISYFTNQNRAGRMDYAARVACNDPIGSGVAEAACKVIVKQRLCGSGMRWKEQGAAAVLSLRTLSYSFGRWDQFWSKIDRWGYPVELHTT
jgi:hypothetical protein